MKIYDKTGVLMALCKETKKYGMYISFSDEENHGRIIADAPYLAKGFDQILNDGEAWLLFDTEEGMHNCYDQTEEDGCVYAMTCNPHGQIETENT